MIRLVKESLYEKFTEDSDPIHDMGIGINIEDYKTKLLSCVLNGMTSLDYSNLKKGFQLNPKKDLYSIHETNRQIPKEIYSKLKTIIKSGKEIFKVTYKEMINHKPLVTLLTVYETEIGKIGKFSYPKGGGGAIGLIQYFGDLSSLVSLENIKK